MIRCSRMNASVWPSRYRWTCGRSSKRRPKAWPRSTTRPSTASRCFTAHSKRRATPTTRPRPDCCCNNPPIPASPFRFNPTNTPYAPAKARLLLQQAGYRGQPIVIQANKRAHVPSYTVAVLSQAMMQAAGINAQIEVLEWATQLDRYNSGNYQMSSFTYSSRLDPALSYEQFSGSKAVQPRKVWDDPDAQRLIVQSFVEADSKKRQALFDQL